MQEGGRVGQGGGGLVGIKCELFTVPFSGSSFLVPESQTSNSTQHFLEH